MSKDDISTEQAYANELMKSSQMMSGLVSDLLRDNRRLAKVNAYLEVGILALLLAVGWGFLELAEDIKIQGIDIRALQMKGISDGGSAL